MLSHQTSNMDQRRRQHRRQQSTPTVFEAERTPSSPATNQSRDSVHRRGMSYAQPMSHGHSQQEYHMVGITNTGHQPQHCLQEAQQHSQARPGPQPGPIQHIQLSAEEFRRLQHQQLDAQLDSLMRSNQFAPHDGHSPHYVKIERSRSNPEQQHGVNQVNGHQHNSSAVQVDSWSPHVDQFSDLRRSRRHLDNSQMSIEEKRMSLQQDWMMQQQRPFTPPGPGSLACFPMTAPNTPYMAAKVHRSPVQHVEHTQLNHADLDATIKAVTRTPKSQVLDHFGDEVGKAPRTPEQNATVRAGMQIHMRRGLSQTALVQGGSPVMEAELLPSPPQTAPVKTTRKFDVAAIPSTLEDAPSVSLMPTGDGSFQMVQSPSPQTSPLEGSVPYEHSPSHSARSSVDFGPWGSPTKAPMSPGEMSIGDLSLYGTVEDTGVSSEEVQSYISEQDPNNGKWICLFPECGKEFGRKENIRSHVQTHLGDRQFRCPACNKRFVRQHDLKRHAKIHSGVKPFPCRCGNSFARQDALTRHRQRGICNGGFEGVVKKVVKRGRPRKERTYEERLDKAMRTRQRTHTRSDASSVSGTSDSSFPDSPPSAMMTDMDTNADFDALASYNPTSLVYHSDFFGRSPPLSPFHAEKSQLLPNQSSAIRSFVSTPASMALEGDEPKAVSDQAAVLPSSFGSQLGSQPGSPPELSHSSPPGSTRLMDIDKAFDGSGTDHAEPAEEGSSSTDFDALAMRLFSQPQEMFNLSWNSSSFGNFDKDTNAFRDASFADQVLFSDSFDEHDGFF